MAKRVKLACLCYCSLNTAGCLRMVIVRICKSPFADPQLARRQNQLSSSLPVHAFASGDVLTHGSTPAAPLPPQTRNNLLFDQASCAISMTTYYKCTLVPRKALSTRSKGPDKCLFLLITRNIRKYYTLCAQGEEERGKRSLRKRETHERVLCM